MRTTLSSLCLVATLSACTPPGDDPSAVSFGTPTTVTVAGRDYAVRAAQNDPILDRAFVTGARDMADAMAGGGGVPRSAAFEPRDTIRVAGATGRDAAIAAIAAWCEATGAAVPPDLARAVIRLDSATNERVWAGSCALAPPAAG